MLSTRREMLASIPIFLFPLHWVLKESKQSEKRWISQIHCDPLFLQAFLDRNWKILSVMRRDTDTVWLQCWWSSAWTLSDNGGWRKRVSSDCRARLTLSRSCRMPLTVERSHPLTGRFQVFTNHPSLRHSNSTKRLQ